MVELGCAFFAVATPVQNLEVFALSGNEVGVIWKGPREMNGVFKGYNVTWCPGMEPDCLHSEVGKALRDPLSLSVDTELAMYRIDFSQCKKSDYVNTSTHYRIPDLEPDQDYRVEVTSITGAGIGEPNSADVRTLPAGVPTGGKCGWMEYGGVKGHGSRGGGLDKGQRSMVSGSYGP